MSEDQEMLDVVDFDDRKIGVASRTEIHDKNLIHRAVHIILTNGDGRFLLQKRSAIKKQHPNKWDVSVSGHVDSGEIYFDAAIRECQEEMGVENVELDRIGGLIPSALTGWEHIQIFAGVVSEESITPDEVEISDHRWVTLEEYEKIKSLDEEDGKLIMTPPSFESMKEWIRVGCPKL